MITGSDSGRDLSRLLAPKSIAVIGGGVWCEAILGAASRIGFDGDVFAVHPEGKIIAGRRALTSLAAYDGAIDAAFIGVNRFATLEVVKELHALRAGGAVCFASGFSEAAGEDGQAAALQQDLLCVAGGMPVLGPNCYGFVNALDRAAIWPDQHGMTPVQRGVAILTQSSNIAINLTMQQRGVPIAYMVTCGNMAQTTQAALAMTLLKDDRVTAIGVHVEGFGALSEWEALADAAADRGIPIVALKAGRSEAAQAAAVSHTASLAGSDAGAAAFLERLGISRLRTLPEFLETLKFLHFAGRLPGKRIAAISCSGGEASLVADLAEARDLEFDPLDAARKTALRDALGPMVALANPLDYHTYIWRDGPRMAAAWAGLSGPETAVTLSIVDYPRTDHQDWTCATYAAKAARAKTGRAFAVVATLPELMPEDVAVDLAAVGVVPMMGLEEALIAVEAASRDAAPLGLPVLGPGRERQAELISEQAAKAELAQHGLRVPSGVQVSDWEAADVQAAGLTAPLALKAAGLAHKSDAGAVRLNLTPEGLGPAMAEMGAADYLIEEMVVGGVAELLIGVLRDPAHGFVLTLGAGGILTELWQDTVSLLVPSPRATVEQALSQLRTFPLLNGYRGRQKADVSAVLDAIDVVQAYVVAHADTVEEVEINPLICTPDGAIAADALIRKETG